MINEHAKCSKMTLYRLVADYASQPNTIVVNARILHSHGTTQHSAFGSIDMSQAPCFIKKGNVFRLPHSSLLDTT